MARDVQIVISSTQKQTAAPGTRLGGFRFRLVSPSTPPGEVVTNETTVLFSAVPPGSYVASVVAVDANGAPLSQEVAVNVDVVDLPPPPQLVEFDAPTALVVNVL